MATTPNPATTEWVPVWNLNDVPTTPNPHHVTHEIGGTDVIANVGWTNRANTFTLNQTINGVSGTSPHLIVKSDVHAVLKLDAATNGVPWIELRKSNEGTNLKSWGIENVGAELRFETLNDDGIGVAGIPLTLKRTGDAVVWNHLTAGASINGTTIRGTNNTIAPTSGVGMEMTYVANGSYGALFTYDRTSASYRGSVVDGSYVGLNSGGTERMRVHGSGGVSIGSTTDPGAGILRSDIRFVVTGGSGTSYSNAPIEIIMTSHPRVGFHWLGVVASSIGMDSAGVIRTYDNPGTNYEKFACAALTATGEARIGGSVISGYYMYPGYVTSPGTQQTSYYIAAHSTYGLFSSTSMWFQGPVYTASWFFEASRATALGHWTSAAPASFVDYGSSGTFFYSFVGKTLHIDYQGVLSFPGPVTSFNIYFPASATSLGELRLPFNHHWGGAGWLSGAAYSPPSTGYVTCYPGGTAGSFPSGGVTVAASLQIPIN